MKAVWVGSFKYWIFLGISLIALSIRSSALETPVDALTYLDRLGWMSAFTEIQRLPSDPAIDCSKALEKVAPPVRQFVKWYRDLEEASRTAIRESIKDFLDNAALQGSLMSKKQTLKKISEGYLAGIFSLSEAFLKLQSAYTKIVDAKTRWTRKRAISNEDLKQYLLTGRTDKSEKLTFLLGDARDAYKQWLQTLDLMGFQIIILQKTPGINRNVALLDFTFDLLLEEPLKPDSTFFMEKIFGSLDNLKAWASKQLSEAEAQYQHANNRTQILLEKLGDVLEANGFRPDP